MMPRLNGWEFRHEQLQDADLKDIPIVAPPLAGCDDLTSGPPCSTAFVTRFDNACSIARVLALQQDVRFDDSCGVKVFW
jgi:hypothetical protein